MWAPGVILTHPLLSPLSLSPLSSCLSSLSLSGVTERERRAAAPTGEDAVAAHGKDAVEVGGRRGGRWKRGRGPRW